MITSISTVRKEQIKKKRLLERELQWIRHEFNDFLTLSDLEARDLTQHVYLHEPPDIR